MPSGPRPPTIADLDMAMAECAAVAHTVRMIALRFQVDAINLSVPSFSALADISGRLLWEPLGMYGAIAEAEA